jgi:hypothetical protein
MVKAVFLAGSARPEGTKTEFEFIYLPLFIVHLWEIDTSGRLVGPALRLTNLTLESTMHLIKQQEYNQETIYIYFKRKDKRTIRVKYLPKLQKENNIWKQFIFILSFVIILSPQNAFQ